MAESALSLVERLRAALDRAEEIAHSMPPFPWRIDDDTEDVMAADGVVVAEPWALSTGQQRRVGRFIAANGPGAVLRTVAAHRAILERHGPHPTYTWACICSPVESCGCLGGSADEDWPCATVLDLAAVYFPEAPDA